MAYQDINLLKHRHDASKELTLIDSRLRVFAWYGLTGLFTVSIILGSLYFYVSSRYSALSTEKTQLLQAIQSQSTKEGIQLSLKQRTAVASNALVAAKPWGDLFALFPKIGPESFFNMLTIDDIGRVIITFELPNIDEAVSVIQNMVQIHAKDQIKSPQLQSLAMKDNGTVTMVVSFAPVFTL